MWAKCTLPPQECHPLADGGAQKYIRRSGQKYEGNNLGNITISYGEDTIRNLFVDHFQNVIQLPEYAIASAAVLLKKGTTEIAPEAIH